MAHYYDEPSHTFSEYLLIPGYTDERCVPANVSLKTPLVKFKKGEEPSISLNIPLVSAIMQSVSDDKMAVALAKEGGISFIYGSQSIENEAAMVRRVKKYKAGFVFSDSNLTPENTLQDVLDLKEATGHSTIAITEDGTSEGKLLGVVSSRDYRVSRMPLDLKIKEFMTPLSRMIVGKKGITLSEANDMIFEHKLNSLPIVDKEGKLVSFVFRKDYSSHNENPLELLDAKKKYIVGAGINSRDYKERVPALVEAGADVLCIDSSEGFSIWQKQTIEWIRSQYGDSVKVGAATSSTKKDSASWPMPGPISSKSASGAAPSASPARPKASEGVRPPRSSRSSRPVTNISKRRASTSPYVPMGASSSTTTSPWLWPWGAIS